MTVEFFGITPGVASTSVFQTPKNCVSSISHQNYLYIFIHKSTKDFYGTFFLYTSIRRKCKIMTALMKKMNLL